MQNITFYVAANETLGLVRDYGTPYSCRNRCLIDE